MFLCAGAVIHPRGEHHDDLLGKGVGDAAAWNMPIFESAVCEIAPSQYMCPANERALICYILGDGW